MNSKSRKQATRASSANGDIVLALYVQNTTRRLKQFAAHWRKKRENPKLKERYPISMGPADWDEQFVCFNEEQDRKDDKARKRKKG